MPKPTIETAKKASPAGASLELTVSAMPSAVSPRGTGRRRPAVAQAAQDGSPPEEVGGSGPLLQRAVQIAVGDRLAADPPLRPLLVLQHARLLDAGTVIGGRGLLDVALALAQRRSQAAVGAGARSVPPLDDEGDADGGQRLAVGSESLAHQHQVQNRLGGLQAEADVAAPIAAAVDAALGAEHGMRRMALRRSVSCSGLMPFSWRLRQRTNLRSSSSITPAPSRD